MNCDVCNEPITSASSKVISAQKFRHMLARGFGISETNVKMLTESGLTRSEAIAIQL